MEQYSNTDVRNLEDKISDLEEENRDLKQQGADSQEKDDELHRYRDQLEDLVKLRTRELLEAIKMFKGEIREREKVEEELLKRTSDLEKANLSLERKNLALEELMDRLKHRSKSIGQNVLGSVEKMILPLIQNLKPGLSERQLEILNHIEQTLEEIASPFIDRLSREMTRLTPTEIRMCNLIRRRLVNKKIAQVENMSTQTVAVHRKNIRRKLGITHKKMNLATYLKNYLPEEKLMDEEPDLLDRIKT